MRSPAPADRQNAQAPSLTGTATHGDRFIIELLGAVVVAAQDGDVSQDQQRAAMVHFLAGGSNGLSGLDGARGGLLVVAELKRGKPLKKQREGHGPLITAFPAQ